MKKMKYTILTMLLSLLMTMPVYAATFKPGDKVEVISASIPVDGATVSFTLPQGTYPKDGAIALYAESNVICPIPGVASTEKTPDKNPYKLLSEYKLTNADIKALAAGEATFITTAKFDPTCGDMYAKVIGKNETAKPSDTQPDRPSGGDGDSVDAEGKPLAPMIAGTVIESPNFTLVGNILTYYAPQGSYTLADWFVIVDADNKVIAKEIITNDIMNTLVKSLYEGRAIVSGLTSTDGLKMMVVDTDYDIGDDITVAQPGEDDKKPAGNGMNPLLVGGIAFVAVLLIGGGYSFVKAKKKQTDTTKQ